MILDKEKQEKFEEAYIPLIKWLCENCHPHVHVIVEPNGAELLEGVVSIKVEDYIQDYGFA